MNAPLRRTRRLSDPSPLDRWRFEAIAGGPEKIWGLTAIADALGLSIDATRKLAQQAEVPIFHPPGSGRYFATRTDLNAWLRFKAADDA